MCKLSNKTIVKDDILIFFYGRNPLHNTHTYSCPNDTENSRFLVQTQERGWDAADAAQDVTLPPVRQNVRFWLGSQVEIPLPHRKMMVFPPKNYCAFADLSPATKVGLGGLFSSNRNALTSPVDFSSDFSDLCHVMSNIALYVWRINVQHRNGEFLYEKYFDKGVENVCAMSVVESMITSHPTIDWQWSHPAFSQVPGIPW